MIDDTIIMYNFEQIDLIVFSYLHVDGWMLNFQLILFDILADLLY